MTIIDAIQILDGVIPPPSSKMVDLDHMPIAAAWAVIKAVLPAEHIRRLDEETAVMAKFPKGTHIRAKYDIEASITPGMLGRVEGYAGDGRLLVFWHNCFKSEAHHEDVVLANEAKGGKA